LTLAGEEIDKDTSHDERSACFSHKLYNSSLKGHRDSVQNSLNAFCHGIRR
jgi:hypothetical protein